MSQKVCYTPNGDSRNALENQTEGWLYAPCDNTVSVSMCCAIGPGRDGSQDVCIDNGLCRNDLLESGTSLIWRESCTDPTWQDPSCIKLFLNGTGFNDTTGVTLNDNGDAINDIMLTQCDDGSWCYGDQNRGCCQNGEGVYLLNGQQVALDPSATSSISSTSSTSSNPPPSTTSSAPGATSASSSETGSSDSGLSTGAQAGIGVGAGLGGLAVIILIIWLIWRQRKTKREPAPAELYDQAEPVMLESSQPRSELPTPPIKSKLDGSTQYSRSSEGFFTNKPPQTGPVEMSA